MKQIILMRKDLKMRRGKEIAQGSHASMAFLIENDPSGNMPTQMLINYHEWLRTGQTKVCLQIHSEKELIELIEMASAKGLLANIITDAGRTEFGGVSTKTCGAIGPNKSEDIDKITKHLKLY